MAFKQLLDLYFKDPVFCESVFNNGKINSLDIFIRTGGSRRRYYFNKIIYNISMAIIFTIISVISGLIFNNEIMSINNDNIKGYFLYYMACASLNIFIRILSKSSYEIVEYGMLFFVLLHLLVYRFAKINGKYFTLY